MTFTATHNVETSTMTVTFDGQSRTFPCRPCGVDGKAQLAVAVFGCKYKSGSRVWGANVLLWENGNAAIESSGYSSGSRGNNANQIVGWWSDVRETVRSQA